MSYDYSIIADKWVLIPTIALRLDRTWDGHKAIEFDWIRWSFRILF